VYPPRDVIRLIIILLFRRIALRLAKERPHLLCGGGKIGVTPPSGKIGKDHGAERNHDPEYYQKLNKGESFVHAIRMM
jgi:hypothetical protein